MSNRGSSAPAIFGRMSALGAFFTGRRFWLGKPEAGLRPRPAGMADMRAQAHGVSINHLPSPSELPAAGLDKAG